MNLYLSVCLSDPYGFANHWTDYWRKHLHAGFYWGRVRFLELEWSETLPSTLQPSGKMVFHTREFTGQLKSKQ